ncbi:MAG: tRNA lysidine(34) synthetase TilS [Gracilibacteraceae bacterium]|jgi:tRNA(Ile)-lysidine synthase|nr:tRNA lysidine(34) synthetase TilS [Gracilibacteraceae bacterium]
MTGRSERLYGRLRASALPALLPPGERVLAAVSGGPDSVALAHILWRYTAEAARTPPALILSHINHGARPEAAAEEELVRELGRRLDLPVLVRRFDAKAYARERRLGFQAAAREWRYARWREDMAAAGCALLATAHHRGDQAETVLHRLLRGGGATGLAGIRPERAGVIRPLLEVSKDEIIAYCAAENLPYAVDASNLTETYDRNRIRLRLLPLLQAEYNVRVEEALSRAAAALAQDEDYFAAVVGEKWPLYAVVAATGVRLSFAAWREPPAILARLLRRAAAEAAGPAVPSDGGTGPGLSYAQVEALRREGNRPGWRQHLPGITALAEREALVLAPAPAAAICGRVLPAPLPVPAVRAVWQTLFWGRASLCSSPPQGFALTPPRTGPRIPDWRGRLLAPLAGEALALLPDQPVWRCRQAGDRCRQSGGWHKSLKNVWQSEGIPASARSLWPLLAAGAEVLWIPGLPPFPAWRPAAGAETVYACADFTAI